MTETIETGKEDSHISVPIFLRSEQTCIEERKLRNQRFNDNIRGCLVGGALGDSFHHEDRKLSAITQLMLATGGGVLYGCTAFGMTGFSVTETDHILSAYRNWYWKQVGIEKPYNISWIWNIPELCEHRHLDVETFSALKEGCGSLKKPKNDNRGAGCLPRVAPIALYHKCPDSNKHIQLAAETAALTHGSPLAWLSASLLVHLISRTIYAGCPKGDYLCGYLWEGKERLFQQFGNSNELRKLFATIDKAIVLAANSEDDTTNVACLNNGKNAGECLGVVIYCALRYPLDFDGAVSAAVNYSGTTAACVIGQLMGAKLGYNRIKQRNDIERLDVILEIADDLTYGECQLMIEHKDPNWISKYYTCDYIS